MIEITCLGPATISVDGAEPPTELVWRKHLALLIYLARSPRGRSRDHLIGLLWPEKDDSKARHSLNEALRVIRRSVGDALITEGDLVRLDPSAVACDVDRVAIPTGQFMEGFTLADAPLFEDWIGAERERLRAKALDSLVAGAEGALDDGDVRGGRELAQRAVDLEPLHEPALRALMRGYALEGGRAQALQVYERIASSLRRELGIEPDPETQDLAARIGSERIVRGAPAAGSVAQDPVPVVGPGRHCLAACLSVWRETLAGHSRLIVIRGDPGTGKTRVGDELAARARLDGAAVAQVRVLESDSQAGVWSALLRGGLSVPELGGAAPEVLAALRGYDPDIVAKFPSARGVGAAPSAEAPILDAIFAVAESRPVLLVLDDAGRAEPAVIETIGAAVQRAGAGRVCAVLTACAGRGEAAVDSLSERIGRDVEGKIVKTDTLRDGDVDELVKWAFPEYDLQAVERLRRRVMADTGGIPFLAVELIRAVQAGLRVGDEAVIQVWPEEARTLDQTIPGELPETVVAALRTRFRVLTEDARDLLRAVAVVGGAETVVTLAAAADVPRKRVERALDELEWERWLVGDAHGYQFVTRLAEKVLLAEMVTAGQRRRMLKRASGNSSQSEEV